MEGLLDANGVWQDDENKMEEIVVDYYSSLFTSSNRTEFDEILNAVQPKVSTWMNQDLILSINESDVRLALKQMYLLKAPGLDGMPPLFFQHFWSISVVVVTKTVLDFLNHGISPPNFNESYCAYSNSKRA